MFLWPELMLLGMLGGIIFADVTHTHKENKKIELERKVVMQEFPSRLIRHSSPNKYDEAPPGTEMIVIEDTKNKYHVYRQISPNPEEPCWQHITTLPINPEFQRSSL